MGFLERYKLQLGRQIVVYNSGTMLEFLTNDEVELRTTGALACVTTDGLLETVGPVNTHQTNHGQEDTYTDTG